MQTRISSIRPKSASRRLLGVFAIFALNLAAMPCTMALEAASEKGHCPTMSEQATTHGGQHDTPAVGDCLSMQSDCCTASLATAEYRGSIEKLQKDASAVVLSLPSWPNLQIAPVPVDEPRPPDLEVPFPPLHVLNCVYLD